MPLWGLWSRRHWGPARKKKFKYDDRAMPVNTPWPGANAVTATNIDHDIVTVKKVPRQRRNNKPEPVVRPDGWGALRGYLTYLENQPVRDQRQIKQIRETLGLS